MGSCRSKALDSFSTHLALTRSGSKKNEKLQVLFEEWAGSEQDWNKSNLIIQMRSRNKHSKKGCRRWLTQREIADKYGSAEIAADIVRLKLEDHKSLSVTIQIFLDGKICDNSLCLTTPKRRMKEMKSLKAFSRWKMAQTKTMCLPVLSAAAAMPKRKIPANPRRGDADPPLRPTAHPPAKAAALIPADLLTLQRLQRPRLRNTARKRKRRRRRSTVLIKAETER